MTSNPTLGFFFSCRVRTIFQFVRTLIARQALIDELEAGSGTSKDRTSFATSEACGLSVDTVKTYARLRHLGLLRLCGFLAVSHVTAAAHTLIACMLRSSNLAFEHRPDLLTAIDILLVFSSPFPDVETVTQLLVQLSRTLDHNHGSNTQSEAVAIRVLARRMARSPSRAEGSLLTPVSTWASWKGDFTQRAGTENLFKHSVGAESPIVSGSTNQSSVSDSTHLPAHRDDMSMFNTATDSSAWLSSIRMDSVESQWMYSASDHAVLGDSFSFLNDGLFSKL